MENTEKPTAKLIGANGNVFNIISIASLALKRNGQHDLAQEMCHKCLKSKSYDEVLSIIQEYVEVE